MCVWYAWCVSSFFSFLFLVLFILFPWLIFKWKNSNYKSSLRRRCVCGVFLLMKFLIFQIEKKRWTHVRWWTKSSSNNRFECFFRTVCPSFWFANIVGWLNLICNKFSFFFWFNSRFQVPKKKKTFFCVANQ